MASESEPSHPQDAAAAVEAPATNEAAHEVEQVNGAPAVDEAELAKRQRENLQELVSRLSSTRALREPVDAATDEQKAGAASYSPTETELDDLSMYIIRIRTDYSVPQLLTRLKQMRPHWSISEKRAEEDEQSQAISGHAESQGLQAGLTPKPISKNDKHVALRLKETAPLLEVRRHGERGRGLFLRTDVEDVAEDTILLTEDAFVYAPSDTWTERVVGGGACSQCGKVLGSHRYDIFRCQQHPQRSSKPLTAKQKQAKEARVESGPTCEIRFCSKTCQETSAKHYGKLVCPQANPTYLELLQLSTRVVRHPVHVFKIWARLISAARRSEKEARDELHAIEALTALPEPERRPDFAEQENVRQIWERSHQLVVGALHIHPAKADDSRAIEPAETEATPAGDSDVENKPVNGVTNGVTSKTKTDSLYQPATEWLSKALDDFSYETFLLWWGRAALNAQDDGGLFLTHSALNHSCMPNARLERSAAKRGSPSYGNEARPSRVYVKALRPIAKGEEITLAYVDPSWPFQQRHQKLKTDYCFECLCDRCEEELRSLSQRLVDGSDGSFSLDTGNGNPVQVFNMNGTEDQADVIRRIVEQAQAQEASRQTETAKVSEIADEPVAA